MAASFLALSGVAYAQPIQQELAGLLVDHPRIKAAKKTIESSEHGVAQADADFMPTVNVTADMGPEYINSPSERVQQDGGKHWLRTRNVAGITVTQNLFDGFASTSASRTARMTKAASEVALRGVRQGALIEGVTAYIDVLRQKRLLELSSQNEDNIRKQLQLEDERVQRGSGITVNVLEAKSRLQLAKERRVAVQGALKDAITRYTQVYGHRPDIDTMTEPDAPMGILPASIGEAEEIALSENPTLDNSNIQMEVAREQKTAARAEYFPTIDLVGAANYEKNKNATVGTRKDFSILVEASWDLYTGQSTKASMAQAAADYGAAQDTHMFTQRKVIEQVRIAWQAIETARDRLDLLENAVNLAVEVHAARQKLREAGKETEITVLDAEAARYNAQINQSSAAFDLRLAQYQLLFAMGRLTPQMLGLAEYAELPEGETARLTSSTN